MAIEGHEKDTEVRPTPLGGLAEFSGILDFLQSHETNGNAPLPAATNPWVAVAAGAEPTGFQWFEALDPEDFADLTQATFLAIDAGYDAPNLAGETGEPAVAPRDGVFWWLRDSLQDAPASGIALSPIPRESETDDHEIFVVETPDGALANGAMADDWVSQVPEFIITTTASDVPIVTFGEMIRTPDGAAPTPQSNTSGPLINVDDFLSAPRFAGIDGSGFAAVILDTGIDLDHDFFGPDGDGDGIADRIVFQYDFADGDADASDHHGHGSNVSSIVASSDSRYTGVAPGADIIHLKVFTDSGAGSFAYIEQALQWVVDNATAYNIASVNMSLGDGGNHDTARAR